MNIYFISRPPLTVDYDTYDSAVVVARTPAEARLIHPDKSGMKWPAEMQRWLQTWEAPERLLVVFVGKPARGTKAGTVIGSSFNAG